VTIAKPPPVTTAGANRECQLVTDSGSGPPALIVTVSGSRLRTMTLVGLTVMIAGERWSLADMVFSSRGYGCDLLRAGRAAEGCLKLLRSAPGVTLHPWCNLSRLCF